MTAATPLTTGRDDRSIRLTGIALMLAGTGLFSFNDALGKYLVATYSVGQLLLLRAFVALVLLSPFRLARPRRVQGDPATRLAGAARGAGGQ